MPWETLEWGVVGNSPASYALTTLAIALPPAILLCGRYLHGLRDGVLLLTSLAILSLAVYFNHLHAAPLTATHVGAIGLAIVTTETIARLLGMCLDAPEVRMARGGSAQTGLARSSGSKATGSKTGTSKSKSRASS